MLEDLRTTLGGLALAAMLFIWGWVSLSEPDDAMACLKAPKPDDSALASTMSE